MKTEVKKIDSTKREMVVEVTGDIVKNKFEEVFKSISKEAKVPGFRPGNAPRDILEKHYSSFAHEQVLKELIPEIYNQALEKETLDVIELPQISEVKLDRSSLSFKATVETSPEIPLKEYKKLKISHKKVAVTADDIKRSIDSLKESRKATVVDDAFAKGLGYSSLAELEKAIERQIFSQRENMERQKIESEIIEQLSKPLDFKIPQSLVDRQMQDLLRQAKLDLAMKGIPRDKIEEQEKELTKELETQARDQVKVYLILAHIAKKENIAIDDHMPGKVMELLLREAEWKEETK